MIMYGTVPPASYADPSDFPFYTTMISNQILEITGFLLEMEREVRRYQQLLEFPQHISSHITEEMEDLKEINDTLMNKTDKLFSAIKSGDAETVVKSLEDVDRTLQESREVILKWNIEKEKLINRQLQNQKLNIETSGSILAQSQISNEALLVLTEQIETLLEMTSESQKLLVAEKAKLYLEEKEYEAQVDEKLNNFFNKESSFNSKSKFNSDLYRSE